MKLDIDVQVIKRIRAKVNKKDLVEAKKELIKLYPDYRLVSVTHNGVDTEPALIIMEQTK